jgi:Domain of unknown function (DUF4167)
MRACVFQSDRWMRPGQHNNNNNKNRNRNRNRRHTGGGGNQGGGGGQGANRVYDSNGPDVKLRGTAHTIAEKYMQLARDAHSSGDSVMAESYYQFSDHYYRVWLAAQPVGQPIQFTRRNAEDEYDEDGNEIVAEAEAAEGEASEQAEGGDAVANPEGEQQADGEGQFQPRNNNRNDRYNNNNNREGGNNRFRQRWPRRNDRYGQDGQPVGNGNDNPPEREERIERAEPEERVAAPRAPEVEDAGNWEAPSFLKRPVEAVSEEVVGEAPAPRPRRGRPPRAVGPVEDAPQGE